MLWKKIGKIFDPTRHHLPNGCVEFAQAPQVLVFSDYYRVYFSTRYLEQETRKFLSHIVYMDFDKDFQEILSVSQHEVIALGKLGTFDEHGIFPLHVMRYQDQVFGYISGVNRRYSVPADGAIGLAFSVDQGRTFQRVADGPVVAPSLREPCINVDPFVLVEQGVFHMWYVFGVEWKGTSDTISPSRVYKIGHAKSKDGLHWHKDEATQILPDVLGQDECQAMPTVIQINGCFHMFFCFRYASDFRSNPKRGYRIGHAYSYDLMHWSRDDRGFSFIGENADWDANMQCYPHVFRDGEDIFMLYNGNDFGKLGFGVAKLVHYQRRDAS